MVSAPVEIVSDSVTVRMVGVGVKPILERVESAPTTDDGTLFQSLITLTENTFRRTLVTA